MFATIFATIRFSIPATLVLCCASAFADPVEPLGSFDIRRSLPPNYASDQITVRTFVANDSGLYFLIDVNPGHPILARTVILHTDPAGTPEKIILLPPTGRGVQGQGVEKSHYGEIRVDSSGNVYLARYRSTGRGKVEKNFVVYSPQGEQKHTIGSEYMRTFCLNNDRIFYIEGVPEFHPAAISVKGWSTDRDAITRWEAYGPLKLLPLTSSKLVALEPIDCRIQIIDLPSGSRKTVSLTPISEVRQGMETQHPDELGRHTEYTKDIARSVVVSDIATTKTGDIYLNVMGHYSSQGAVIVKLDEDGNFSRSLRCGLPEQMFPRHIGVAGTRVFVEGSGKVVRFPI